jgi:RNA polymerase subunit RPABC4/transcription elongation factor Spt4
MGSAVNSCVTCGRMLVSGQLCPVCSTDKVPQFDMDTIVDPAIEAALDRLMAPEKTQVTASPYEVRARYTGRADALGRLVRAIERSRSQSQVSFAVVVGEPGMGKTATVNELARTIKQRWPDMRLLIGSADGSGVLYALFGRLLATRFGVTAADGIDDAHDKIIAGVGEVMPAARVTEAAHLIAYLMRLPFPDSPIIAPLVESPQQLEARTFLALRRFLAADAAAGPLVLCFENLELAEPESLNLLHYVVAGLSS